jgi:hypothetical protein
VSEFELAGAAVLAGSVVLPRAGAWHADLHVDVETAIGPAAELVIYRGTAATTWVGTVRRGGVFQESAPVRLVGGYGGLGTDLEAKYYREATVRQVLDDVMRETGEQLSTEASAQLLDVQLARWTRRAGRADLALAALFETLGTSWRILTDGTLWCGAETWPEVDVEHLVVNEWPIDGRVEIDCEEFPTELLPGTTFLERRVARV